MTIKTDAEIEAMHIGGKILAEVLEETCKLAKPGISTKELDDFAEKFILDHGAKPAFKGYHGFPATICLGLNEVIVHGIPRKDVILKEGDLLTIDCGVLYKGLYTDAARSIPIGEIDEEKQRLLKTVNIALEKAISLVKEGVHTGALGRVIEETAEKAGLRVVKELTGHGVGKTLHEEPTIYNYFESPGPALKAGMTIAIEPIFAVGTSKTKTLDDNWSIVTADGSPSVQQENTILVTKTGYEILTA